ncbi:MAG: PKD domain-containing protein [Solirubrobacterales bacterium]|nr:PKD domain-containing protein [Solirubrobacterales bacterium]
MSSSPLVPRCVRRCACAVGPCALFALAALGTPLLAPAPAGAVIGPPSVLEPPSNEILEVDGAAMARDGTGGILYRKNVGGIAHIFVAPFANGHWRAPIQADAEDLYGASQPAIAAGDNGRLLVVWVQPRNVASSGVTLYELMSASLQPGASSFARPIIVDPSVGEPHTGDISGVDPALAMAPDGTAYVVYRVIVSDCDTNHTAEPPNSACINGSSDKLVDVRVARFRYLLWSSPETINRAASQVAMLSPSTENAPAIAIARNDNGVVAWQEPQTSGGPARIWARRLFGTVPSNVLQVSPETLDGRQVTSEADGVALAVGPFGEAQLAYRIHGAPGTAVPVTQLYLNSLVAENAPGSQLQGSVAVTGAAAGALGAPSAAIDPSFSEQKAFRVAWTQGGALRELSGANAQAQAQSAIGAAVGPAPTTVNPTGGGTTAWLAPPGSPPSVQVREDYPQAGAFQRARLSGTIPGPVAGLAFAGDGQGDALLAFSQGPPGDSEVVGAFVQGPPAPFLLTTPTGWVRAAAAKAEWEPPFDAIGGVTYAVYVDGRPRMRGLTQTSARIAAARLGSGVHQVQVLASDSSGLQTMSPAATLKLDASPPIVRVRLVNHRRGVRVRVTDNASGVDAAATVIRFGDGHTARGRDTVAHGYARAGVYWITARVRDRLGIAATDHLRVRAR